MIISNFKYHESAHNSIFNFILSFLSCSDFTSMLLAKNCEMTNARIIHHAAVDLLTTACILIAIMCPYLIFKLPVNLTFLTIHMDQDAVIPSNFLSGKQVLTVVLDCPSTKVQLQIDSNGMRSSANYTTFLQITSCDFSRLDFSFLDGFNHLIYLELYDSIGIESLQSLKVWKFETNERVNVLKLDQFERLTIFNGWNFY